MWEGAGECDGFVCFCVTGRVVCLLLVGGLTWIGAVVSVVEPVCCFDVIAESLCVLTVP